MIRFPCPYVQIEVKWTEERELERTLPHGIQTQQKSQETAESPPALVAAGCNYTSSFGPDTTGERQPGRHDDNRRNHAAYSSALRGGGCRQTASHLRLIALSGI